MKRAASTESYCTLLIGAASRAQVVVAESYGGRDEPVDTLVANLVGIDVVPLFDPLRVKALPTEATYQVCAAGCTAPQRPRGCYDYHCSCQMHVSWFCQDCEHQAAANAAHHLCVARGCTVSVSCILAYRHNGMAQATELVQGCTTSSPLGGVCSAKMVPR